jgi:hypothetical protein
VNREMIDSAAAEFCLNLNTKINRKKLVKWVNKKLRFSSSRQRNGTLVLAFSKKFLNAAKHLPS